jgi:hypothetical protein
VTHTTSVTIGADDVNVIVPPEMLKDVMSEIVPAAVDCWIVTNLICDWPVVRVEPEAPETVK